MSLVYTVTMNVQSVHHSL